MEKGHWCHIQFRTEFWQTNQSGSKIKLLTTSYHLKTQTSSLHLWPGESHPRLHIIQFRILKLIFWYHSVLPVPPSTFSKCSSENAYRVKNEGAHKLLFSPLYTGYPSTTGTIKNCTDCIQSVQWSRSFIHRRTSVSKPKYHRAEVTWPKTSVHPHMQDEAVWRPVLGKLLRKGNKLLITDYSL